MQIQQNISNPGFEGGFYTKKNVSSVQFPNGWEVGWLDQKPGPRHEPQCAPCLKPEVEVINLETPYLDPPRIDEGQHSVKIFKSFGTMCVWLSQTIPASRGMVYSFTARAHAWALDKNDLPFDPHKTTGVGTEPFFALENTPLTDAQRNFRFRVGIDPTGGTDPFAPSVVWGHGAHIYNAFASIPNVEAIADEDWITLFICFDNLWGFRNSDAYIDTASLTITSVPVLGDPRIQYEREVWVVPQDISDERYIQICMLAKPGGHTVGFSYDDGGVGNLKVRRVVLWDLPETSHQEFFNWYNQYYPGVQVSFRGDETIPPQRPSPDSKLGLHILKYSEDAQKIIDAQMNQGE